MCDINAKITISQSNSDNKDVEVVMKETEATSTGTQTSKDENNSENTQNKPNDGNGKIDFKCCWCPVVLFILLMIIFIGGIVCSVVFIKDVYEPFKNSLNFATCIQLPACVGCKTVVDNSANFAACIQYTVSLALVLAAVIITSISLIKAAKWLIKVDLIKQVLNSSCNAEQKKKYCDTLVDL